MKNTKKTKIKKGDFGYFSSEKKRRLLITAGLFSLPLIIFFTAWAVNGTRMTVWTVLTVVGCLPGCKSMVSLIMILYFSVEALPQTGISFRPVAYILPHWKEDSEEPDSVSAYLP